MEWFQKINKIWQVPDGMAFFLDLYEWESVLFSIFAPILLAVPISLIIHATHFHFFISLFLVIIALIITIPWLLVPYWMIKTKSQNRWFLVIWAVCNVCVMIMYFILMT